MSIKRAKYTQTKGLMFFCPGCREIHLVPNNWFWKTNGDEERPTIKGSSIYGKYTRGTICHFWIKDGYVLYHIP